MMRVCMLVRNTFLHDARVLREALALVEDGHHVTVVATPVKDVPTLTMVQGIRVLRAPSIRGFGVRTRLRVTAQELEKSGEVQAGAEGGRGPMAHWLVAAQAATLRGIREISKRLRRFIRGLLLTGAYVALCVGEQPDVIHAHDLNTLRAGMVAKRRSGARLVYDAHELEAGRVQHNVFERWLARLTERLWIRSADRVITVSPSIGDFLARRYHLPPPTIILNVPHRTDPGPARDLRGALGVGKDVAIVLYQGGILPHRGLEQLGEAVGLIEKCMVVMLGPDYWFGTVLDDHFRKLGVSDHIRRLPPVPSDELLSWTAAADVGICTIVDASLSYRFSLPNKLFEYMAAGIPVVASDLPELRRVVVGEQIGELCDPTDPTSIASAISRILNEPELMNRYRANARRAAKTYNWDIEKQKLLDLYRSFESDRGQSQEVD